MTVVIEKIDDHSLKLKNTPTPSQWQAIAITGTDILVSAAAGSGKTEVLSERIARKIAINKWDINKILVLTFTTAASESMLVRIQNKYEERLSSSNKKEDIEHLKRQRLLIGNAQISTIDSFCNNLLKKFYYLVEEDIKGEKFYLSPDFKILSNNKYILNNSLEEVLENYSKNKFSEMDFLINIFNDKKEIAIFLKNIYIKLLSFPNYQNYIKNELTKNIKILLGSINYEEIYSILNEINEENFYTNIDTLEVVVKKYKKELLKELSVDEKLKMIITNSKLDKSLAKDLFSIIEFNEEDDFLNSTLEMSLKLEELLNLILDYKNNKNIFLVYTSFLEVKYFLENFYILEKLQKIIVELLLLLDSDFLYKKRKENYLDFSDLNHLSIKALEFEKDGKKFPSEATVYYKNLFLEIFVDEYQDNNDLQEYILNLVRGSNVNFFRVGDVKQSIYGFRGSNPELFEEKYTTYIKLSELITDYDINKEYKLDVINKGICVVLKENFRSEENILRCSNFIFNRLMNNKNAGISYDEDSALYYPLVKQKEEQIVPTYIMSQPNEEKITNEYIVEQIALEINKQIKEQAGKVSYKDFAILIRNATNIKKYSEIFKKHNIPIYYKEKEGLVESHSFNILYNLLKFIDDFTNDISLLIILKSAMFNYEENELLMLVLENGNNLYEKLKNSNNEKNINTLKILNRWLNYSYNNSAINLIKTISWETNFLEYMRSFNIDDSEVYYFENFLEILTQTSEESINLSYTLNILSKIKNEGEYDTKQKASSDSVTISTIHISKGLEYKKVFVIDLDKSFSEKDFLPPLIFSKYFGLTFNLNKILQSNANSNLQKMFTINTKIIKRKNIEEEIRNLYVALTRAESELYLATTKNINFKKEFEEKNKNVKTNIEEIKSFHDMLYSVLINYSSIKEENDNFLKEENRAVFKHFDFKEIIEKNKKDEKIDNDIKKEKSVNLEEIKNFDFVLENSIKKEKIYPSKTSYSSIKKFNTKEKSYNKKLLTLKSSNNKLSKSLFRGNLIHKIFEKIVNDIFNKIEIQEVEKYILSLKETNNKIENIKKEKILSNEEFEELNNLEDIKKIGKFITTITKIIKSCKKIETEIMFTNIQKVKDLFYNTKENDDIILQGVVDLLIETKNKFIIIDYKTDYVKGKNEEDELVKRHSRQLELYSKALKDYYNDKIIVKKYIYSYHLCKLIKV